MAIPPSDLRTFFALRSIERYSVVTIVIDSVKPIRAEFERMDLVLRSRAKHGVSKDGAPTSSIWRVILPKKSATLQAHAPERCRDAVIAGGSTCELFASVETLPRLSKPSSNRE
jgi:hypothetical protein